MQNHVSYNKNSRYTEVCMSYGGLFGCVQFAGKTKVTLLDSSKNNSYILKARVHNIYTERECPTLHMLCTNTLRKVMTQQPLTAKVLIKLKPYVTLKFWQVSACNVLKMCVD